MRRQALLLTVLSVFLMSGIQGCKKSTQTPEDSAKAQMKEAGNEPQIIKVQHILVAFKGTLPGQSVERSKEEAAKLARDLLEKARAPGANFEALVSEFSSDRPPGVYEMTNFGVAFKPGTFPREQMVPAFGDIGFKLKVGEVGLAEFDEKKSPFGFHIIKRLN